MRRNVFEGTIARQDRLHCEGNSWIIVRAILVDSRMIIFIISVESVEPRRQPRISPVNHMHFHLPIHLVICDPGDRMKP